MLAWAVGVLRAPIVGWRALPQADDHGPWRIDLGDEHLPRRAVLGLGDPGDTGLATEVAALGVCAMTGIPAPRVLAVDVTGGEASRPVLVQSWITGESRVPEPGAPSRARELGRVAARIHSVAMGPTDVLPERASSLATVPFSTLPVPAPATDLLAEVRETVAATPAPTGPPVLVHGDLWQGNTLWDDGEHVGTLDWDYAGVGHPLVDLGSLRWDLAVLAGEGHDDVIAGWQEASDRRLPDEEVARGDLVAVLASPPDLALWLPNFHAQGRPDLTLEVVTARRDAFARAALAALR
ncbi:MAG TPA: aminoglycoside phosphotransferase family protein [Iamia sp.]